MRWRTKQRNRPTAVAVSVLVGVATTYLGATSVVAAPATTPIMALGDVAAVSARGDVIAVTQHDVSSARLFVGVGVAAPSLVPEVGSLPRWAHPHVGTDSQGRTVVVYPRCSDASVSSCDLWQYRVDRRTAVRLSGVNSATKGETEGAMDHGALAYTRWTAETAPPLGNGVTPTTLMYKPAGRSTRVVTKRGGQQLALSGDLIAQARLRNPNYGECGTRAVETITTTGHRHTVRTYICGLDGHTPLGLAFVDGRLLWAMHGFDQGHYAQYVVATGKTYYENVSTEWLYGYAPVRTDGGPIVEGYAPALPQDWQLGQIAGLTYPRAG